MFFSRQSKKRGLSLEEKRKRMLDLFIEKNEFLHLKEVEKLAPKLKGISKNTTIIFVYMLPMWL